MWGNQSPRDPHATATRPSPGGEAGSPAPVSPFGGAAGAEAAPNRGTNPGVAAPGVLRPNFPGRDCEGKGNPDAVTTKRDQPSRSRVPHCVLGIVFDGGRGAQGAAGLGSVPGRSGGTWRRCRRLSGGSILLRRAPRCFPADVVLEEGCAGRRMSCRAPAEDPESPPRPGRGIKPGLECESLHPGTAPQRQVLGARGSSASAGGDVPPP